MSKRIAGWWHHREAVHLISTLKERHAPIQRLDRNLFLFRLEKVLDAERPKELNGIDPGDAEFGIQCVGDDGSGEPNAPALERLLLQLVRSRGLLVARECV